MDLLGLSLSSAVELREKHSCRSICRYVKRVERSCWVSACTLRHRIFVSSRSRMQQKTSDGHLSRLTSLHSSPAEVMEPAVAAHPSTSIGLHRGVEYCDHVVIDRCTVLHRCVASLVEASSPAIVPKNGRSSGICRYLYRAPYSGTPLELSLRPSFTPSNGLQQAA